MFCNNNNNTQAQWTNTTMKSEETENTFKTTNNKIFPSLNPLGSFYKQRKTTMVHPNPSFQGHNEAPQPVKKQRLNNGIEGTTAQAPQGRGSVQPFSQSQVDKDGFRIPQLPKRLLQKKSEKKAVEQKVSQKRAQKPQKKAVEEPLAIKDDFMKGFRDLQLSLVDFLQHDNSMKVPMMIHSTNVAPKQSNDEALFQRLNLEYYSMILNANISHLTEMSKKAEQLLQNHNVNPLMYNNYSMSQSLQLC